MFQHSLPTGFSDNEFWQITIWIEFTMHWISWCMRLIQGKNKEKMVQNVINPDFKKDKV